MSDDPAIWDTNLIREHLIGVIDLRRGQAVHAIAGNRNDYAPVKLVNGDPVQLARVYANFGLRKIYVADLDAIEFAVAPSDWLLRIIEVMPAETIMLVDIGWRGDENTAARQRVKTLSSKHLRLGWIAASEAAKSTNSLRMLGELVDRSRVWMGMDYRNQKWVSGDVNEHEWLAAAELAQVQGAVILDLKSVGSGAGPSTAAKCRELSAKFPDWQLISGGGIRSATDVRQLLDAGCHACLVATAIQHHLVDKS